MGDKAREIIGEKLSEKVIGMLNTALCDEWVAYFQYWAGAQVAEGENRNAIQAELFQHAEEEKRHADKLANRVIELGGTPVINIKKLISNGDCPFAEPSDPCVRALLKQNILGERCAISSYSSLLKEVKDYDPVTWLLVLGILSDEIGHEEDLQRLLEDLQHSEEMSDEEDDEEDPEDE